MQLKFSGHFLSKLVLASTFLFPFNASSTHGVLRDDCYSHLLSQLSESPSYDEVSTMVQTLKKRDLRCLYNSSIHLGAPGRDFFLPDPEHPKEVTILSGKNSMPFANIFEKHVFPIEDNTTLTDAIYGYNVHSAMKLTGPGFFKVVPFDNFVVLDFTSNFVKEIPKDELNSFSGIKADTPCNNNCNLIYGGDMRDYCHRLLFDEETGKDIAIVCEAHRTFLGLIRAPFLWDILIRKD